MLPICVTGGHTVGMLPICITGGHTQGGMEQLSLGMSVLNVIGWKVSIVPIVKLMTGIVKLTIVKLKSMVGIVVFGIVKLGIVKLKFIVGVVKFIIV